MARKTQGVYLLANDVLATIPQPYNEDVIYDVFRSIEDNPLWMQEYEALGVELQNQKSVNNWIAKYVKQITGMETIREVDIERGHIITAYSKLRHAQ